MWEKRSHKLALLAQITSGKVKFKWTKIEQEAFKEIKWVVVRDVLLAYPDFNEEFKIHSNASNLKLGEVTIHNVKPISSYGRKVTDPKNRYTVTEK